MSRTRARASGSSSRFGFSSSGVYSTGRAGSRLKQMGTRRGRPSVAIVASTARRAASMNVRWAAVRTGSDGIAAYDEAMSRVRRPPRGVSIRVALLATIAAALVGCSAGGASAPVASGDIGSAAPERLRDERPGCDTLAVRPLEPWPPTQRPAARFGECHQGVRGIPVPGERRPKHCRRPRSRPVERLERGRPRQGPDGGRGDPRLRRWRARLAARSPAGRRASRTPTRRRWRCSWRTGAQPTGSSTGAHRVEGSTACPPSAAPRRRPTPRRRP